ncbi:MAG: 4'-phosphopantetheinyl transferase superfamily protein [Parafilimonas sp.]|nr:4'-phosphopantetheinyl transferase superfamily protein [Parafilimonas sp.]
MISIGNDIISLQLINPERTKQKKFYSKIICKQETELFSSVCESNISFEKFVWLAWSIKESVYKFNKRNNMEAAFSPTKIIIEKIELPVLENVFRFNDKVYENIVFKKKECYCCEVRFNSSALYARTIINDEMIFTVVNDTDYFENVYCGIKEIDNDSYVHQSESVRHFVLNKLNQLFQNKNFSIQKSETGYPFIQEKKYLPLSFAHHGSFVAYAFATA